MQSKQTAAVPSLSDKRVLVTGASGFIGGNLCNRLAANGAEVHAVSRTTSRDLPAAARPWNTDLSRYDDVKRLFNEIKPSIVFHLAGYVQGSRNLDQIGPAMTGNLTTAVNILTAATEAGCERILLTGSQDEPDPGEACATEFVPPSPYAAAKLAGSAYARMFHALYQCPVTIGRIFMGYGPAQRDLKKLLPYAILSILRGEAPKMGSGARPMDWVYVEDIIDGMLLMAKAPNVVGHTVHLGTGNVHTARQAVEMIVRLMESPLTPSFGAVADRQMEKVRFANVKATQERLGWQPVVAFEDGLRKTIAWYKAQVASGAISRA
ncbi:MAG TPA: NAD(P)-dependent oxidoreductase [Verrucomicrobiae bacterium]|nr:NAD(P)-dependent oxidoreductase [Verrucomicrobiae bacterium]